MRTGKNIRICMVGVGRVGKLHSTTICQYVPEAQVVALVQGIRQAVNLVGRFNKKKEED